MTHVTLKKSIIAYDEVDVLAKVLFDCLTTDMVVRWTLIHLLLYRIKIFIFTVFCVVFGIGVVLAGVMYIILNFIEDFIQKT